MATLTRDQVEAHPMTDTALIERVARAIYTAWYECRLSGVEKTKTNPPATWEEVSEAFKSHGDQYPEIARIVKLARLEATAAIQAMIDAGWKGPDAIALSSKLNIKDGMPLAALQKVK